MSQSLRSRVRHCQLKFIENWQNGFEGQSGISFTDATGCNRSVGFSPHFLFIYWISYTASTPVCQPLQRDVSVQLSCIFVSITRGIERNEKLGHTCIKMIPFLLCPLGQERKSPFMFYRWVGFSLLPWILVKEQGRRAAVLRLGSKGEGW